MSTPRWTLFSAAVLSHFTALLLAAAVNPASLLVLIPVSVVVVYYSVKNLEGTLAAMFFLLPFFGEIQERLNLKAVPVEFVFIFGLIAGAYGKKMVQASIREKVAIPKPVFFYLLSLILSLIVSLVRTTLEFASTKNLHNFSHQLGWVMLFFLLPVSGFYLYILMTEFMDSRPNYFRFLVALFIGMFISSLVGYFQYTGIASFSTAADLPIIGRFEGTFIDANAMGVCAGLLLPLWIALFFERGKRRMLVFGPSLFFMVYIAGSRSAVLICAVALLCFLMILKPLKKKLLATLILTLGLVFVLFFGKVTQGGFSSARTYSFAHQMARLVKAGFKMELSKDEQASSNAKAAFTGSVRGIVNDRPALWKAGLVVIRHHPFLGVGIGRYLTDMPKYAEEIGRVVNDNSCNMYIQIAAEQGILGLVFFVIMIVYFSWKWFKRQHKEEEYLQLAGFSSIMGLLVSFIFGAHLVNAEVNTLFWFLLTMTICSERRKNERSAEMIS